MSFVKHAIFVNNDAPKLISHDEIIRYILNRINIDDILVSKGVIDHLDHSSPKFAVGGKLGLDCTGNEIEELGITILDDVELLSKMQSISSEIKGLKQYYKDTKNPVCVISVDKQRSQKYIFEDLKPLYSNIKILIIVDEKTNDLDNPYMLIWRVTNNIDSNRDLYIEANTLCLDGTNKNSFDNFSRRWPGDVNCTKSVIDSLRERKILDIDDEFIKTHQLY